MAVGPANVVAHGADPTGSAASQSAFAAAIAANGGRIYVPNGAYRFTAGVTVNRRLVIEGFGSGDPTAPGGNETGSLIFGSGVSGALFTVPNGSADIRGLRLRGAGVGISTGSQMQSARFSDIIVDQCTRGFQSTGENWESRWERIKVINPLIGFDFGGSSNHTTNLLEHCIVDGLQANGIGFLLLGLDPSLQCCMVKNVTQPSAVSIAITGGFCTGLSVDGFIHKNNQCPLWNSSGATAAGIYNFASSLIDTTGENFGTTALIRMRSGDRMNLNGCWFAPDAETFTVLQSGGTINAKQNNRDLRSWGPSVGTIHGFHDGVSF